MAFGADQSPQCKLGWVGDCSHFNILMLYRLGRCVMRAIRPVGSSFPCGPLRRASTVASIQAEDIYDVVIVGGGIVGLALVNGLCMSNSQCLLNQVSSDATRNLRIAIIERNKLKGSVLMGSPRNRCSSLTPASVRFLQGVPVIKPDY
jgi:hypothetical protein